MKRLFELTRRDLKVFFKDKGEEIVGSGYLPAQPTVGGKQIFHRR